LIVWHVGVTRPAVPSAVSYADVREGHDPYSACGHGTHRHPPGTRTVREGCLCSPPAERGLDGGDGAQRCTLATRRDHQQAKEAERLGPNMARERGPGLRQPRSWTANAPGGPRAPPPSLAPVRNVVSPYRSFLKGSKVVRPSNGDAGMGVGTSAWPPGHGAETGRAKAFGNRTRRASGQTARRCLGTRTTEASIQQVWHMAVASCHWGYRPRQGLDWRLVSCSQHGVFRLTGPSHGLCDA
jgi:hypothetical protein